MKVKTIICPLRNDKTCAVSFTTDDALYRSCNFYQSRFKEYGLKGTAMLPTNFICPSPNSGMTESNGFGSWEQWQAFLSEGFFDVANHTKSHPYLDKVSAEQLEEEVNGAQALLRSKFPGQKVVCMANPYVVTNDAIDDIIRQHHYSARNGQTGFNTLNPTEKEWYRLNFQIALHQSTAESMNLWIDEAIEKKLWLIEMWHGVDGQGWEPPASQECDRHLACLSKKLDTVWNGTMEEVTLYLREKQHATLETVYSGDDEIHIVVKMDLDTALFDYPLTLETEVPAGWNAVGITKGGCDEAPDIRIKKGTRVVQYDAVPNAGEIILRNIPR